MNVYNFQSTDCASSHPKSKNTYVNPESSTPDNRTAIQGIYGETNIITESGDEDVLRPITSKRKHPLIEEISVSQSTSKERNYTDTSNHKKSKHQESWNLRVQINKYIISYIFFLLMTQLYWNIWITLRNFDVNDSKSIQSHYIDEN